MIESEFKNANLKYILDYTGTRQGDIEADIYRIALQGQSLVHYDRVKGGSFEDLEQEPNSQLLALLFTKNIIESIYLLNQERGYNPYIVVGYEDIEIIQEDDQFIMNIKYKLLQDLENSGAIRIPL